MSGREGLSGRYFIYGFVLLFALQLWVILTSLKGPDKNYPEYTEQLYSHYVSGDISGWKEIIANMESSYQSDQDPYLLKQIIYSLYGYVGYHLGMDQEETAEVYLEKMEGYLDEVMEENKTVPAWAFAMHAASVGYRISLNRIMAPFLGQEALNSMDKAIETDSSEVMGWIEKGNSFMYRPAYFGGSSKKALENYERALSLFQGDEAQRKYSWIYLNLQVLIAKCHIDLGNYDLALQSYQNVITYEPSFSWVRDELMPEVEMKIRD
ncbi:MAG: hypothetical protein P8100_06475 [bacterium]|jgi:tetratricopeptide (TPR) repeat protein